MIAVFPFSPQWIKGKLEVSVPDVGQGDSLFDWDGVKGEFPSPELLERLEASGARVLRTDRDGAAHVLTDGPQMEVSCFVA